MKRVLVGVPCMETIPVDTINSLLNLKGISNKDIHFEPLSLVYIGRQRIIEKAIFEGYDYVLFIDSDMVFMPNLLEKLLEADKDIVTGLAFMRKPPYYPCIYSVVNSGSAEDGGTEILHDFPEGELIQIAGCGMACCLIKRKVFEDVYNQSAGFHPNRYLGEDLAYCLRARALGHEVWCDTSVRVGHIGTTIITENDYRWWKEASLSEESD